MTTLAEIRAQNPQYADMSDADMAGALHKKFYADMPREDFDRKMGLVAAKPAVAPATPEERQTESAAQFLKGIPIAGAYVDQAGAALSAAANPLTGAGAPGETYGERYTQNLKRNQEVAQQVEKESPILSTAAQVGGGILATAPLAATNIGAKLLGLAGPSLKSMMGYGAASGGAISAADAVARGHDATLPAVIGTAIGGGTAPAGRVIGGAVSGVRNMLPGRTTPQNVVDVAGTRVPISTGQASGDVTTQALENAALRGGSGQRAQQVAEQFFRGEQAPAVEQARSNIGTGLDRFGANVVDSPIGAGELVSEQVKRAAAQSKAGYQGLYDEAMSLPGEIHAGAFEGIGQKIKGTLTLGRDPVIIDDVTTPIASRALQQIEENISRLKVQNKADPFGAPSAENIVGVNLAGYDQTRKQLISMASAAEKGSADHRAIGRIIGSFDDHVEDAISRGLFTGDERALDALRDARRAFSQHKSQFASQGRGDDVGRAMERIVGHRGGEGATATEVANMLYGEARIGGSGLSVRLAQRLQNVLGPESPEWVGIRQGLWSKLTEATEGRIEMGTQKASERISEFLNGSGKPLAHVLFAPNERALMGQYAGLLQQLTPKPGTVNYSNTATTLSMLANQALKGIGTALGATAGGPMGAVGGLAAGQAAGAIGERSTAGHVARSLYGAPGAAALQDEAARRRSALISAIVGRGSQPALASEPPR